MRNTVSSGIVSAFRTDVVLRSEELTDIQITVPVSSGSSGGPMLDMYGNVKGIIYAKHLLAENANFAIPIGDFYPLLEHISPLSFEEMQSQVAAAIEAAEAAQSEPSSCTQSAAVSYID
jgi:S1-C subfamily serine protease